MKYVTYQVIDRIAYISLNRPEKRNALNSQLILELTHAFIEAENDIKVKVIILKANGNVFCAGADLKYIQQLQSNNYQDNLEDSTRLKNLFYKIYTHPKIVIAQVEGHAIAGGSGLATVCDFTFATPEAKFGYTEVKIGFIPAIVKVFLLRKIGETHAKELLLTGNLIDAARAYEIGLINRVIPLENITEEVKSFARDLIVNNSAQSMAVTKRMIAEIQGKSLSEGLQYAAERNAEAREHMDCKKGIAAFLNKEKITW